MIDDRRHFGVHVVQRAKTNSTLMNAILALSARQLSRTSDFDPYVADSYYQRCFETLIPALNDNVAIRDESLLAATIILRLLEEMNSECDRPCIFGPTTNAGQSLSLVPIPKATSSGRKR